MIHILFGASASGSLRFVIREMGLDKKEKVISFWEKFSIGPVWKLNEEIGVKSRFEWMKKSMCDEFGEYSDYIQGFEKVLNQINSIPEGDHVTIWTSNNAHEQTGLRFVVYLLKERNIDVTVINTSDVYCIIKVQSFAENLCRT